ncbi:hypothetical protein [Phaffia rhodozyma]|uniref:Uncharacterized protein n=1 Tax=Phaffia rhodozyma TaxID=264483 RepID=A0A0F7SNZ0_PHARH|nr:hypothetical protein [Phaffia rhodozyma]
MHQTNILSQHCDPLEITVSPTEKPSLTLEIPRMNSFEPVRPTRSWSFPPHVQTTPASPTSISPPATPFSSARRSSDPSTVPSHKIQPKRSFSLPLTSRTCPPPGPPSSFLVPSRPKPSPGGKTYRPPPSKSFRPRLPSFPEEYTPSDEERGVTISFWNSAEEEKGDGKGKRLIGSRRRLSFESWFERLARACAFTSILLIGLILLKLVGARP